MLQLFYSTIIVAILDTLRETSLSGGLADPFKYRRRRCGVAERGQPTDRYLNYCAKPPLRDVSRNVSGIATIIVE